MGTSPDHNRNMEQIAGETERLDIGRYGCAGRLRAGQSGERDTGHQRHVRRFTSSRSHTHWDGPVASSPSSYSSWQSSAWSDTPSLDTWPTATVCGPVALIGNASFALCVAALAFSTNQRPFVYTLYALTGMAGTLSSCVLLMKPISLWFTRHRGLLFALTGAFGIISALP